MKVSFLVLQKILVTLALLSFSLLTSTVLVSVEGVSPVKQLDKGADPKDVTCKAGFVLVLKSSSKLPACVKESTANILLERGWASEIIDAKKSRPFTSGTWNPQTQQSEESAHASSATGAPMPAPSHSGALQFSQSESLGFSVGGAKDVDNFRENIENDYLPLPSDMTHEGLFYDYYFDTGKKQECQKLFCPSYSYAIFNDPISSEEQYYLSVGLNSGMTEQEFERKKLNLVIVLDVSGSMSSSFSSYYYDQLGDREPHELTEEEKQELSKAKIQVATESLAGLVDHLDEDDHLGVVPFNNGAHLAKPLESMAITDVKTLKDNILEIHADGGTNLHSGMKLGTSLFENILDDYDPAVYENRIIFLTDAMPNLGDTSESGLFGLLQSNSQKNIFTTFIGIGVDFNTELIEKISKVKGANYYSVHSSEEFKKRMVEEFEFMVTPLVFDLTLRFDSDKYRISEVYGSPDADSSTGEIMKVNTLFPSKVREGETRGGVVLLKLEKISETGSTILKTTYQDRNENKGGDEVSVFIDDTRENYFENSGIRKATLLSRYANLLQAWAYDQRQAVSDKSPTITPSEFKERGIFLPDHVVMGLGKWERQSIPLQVSDEYRGLIQEFSKHFTKEAGAIQDPTLEQETKLMQKLLQT